MRRTDFLAEWNLDTARRWRGARVMMVALTALAAILLAMSVLAATAKARYAHTLSNIEEQLTRCGVDGGSAEAGEPLARALDPEWLQSTHDSAVFWADVLGTIAVATPKGIVLSNLSSEQNEWRENELVVRGTARSFWEVSQFTSELDAAPALSRASITRIGGDADGSAVEFECRAQLLFDWARWEE